MKGVIVDTGDDKMVVRLMMNKSERENIIFANFYIPICENRRVMIGGSGRKCKINSFSVSNIDLQEEKEEMKLFSYDEEKDCEEIRRPYCCSMF
jgi:hypothetical protein